MLKLKLNEILLKSGIKNPQQWLRKECGFGQRKAFNMVHSKQMAISLDDLTILCQKLNCAPDDLFYWESSPDDTISEDHPLLTKLKKPDKTGGWFKFFETKTPQEIQRLYEKIVASEEKDEAAD